MYRKTLIKPDGRKLFLYSQRELSDDIVATSPSSDPSNASPHMRWHPLRQEWVIYAAHRQNRTFLPPKDYSPLSVSINKEFPTEMPVGDYDVAVFENLFPSMNLTTAEAPNLSTPTRPAEGICEVVVFTQDPDSSLGKLSVEHIKLVLEVWADRVRLLGARDDIQYVMPFENKGVEMGVTLHHPHGQIYAYSFIPPVVSQMLSSMKEFYEKFQRGLLDQMIQEEKTDGRRIIIETEHSIAFIPVCARYPYETWVTPKRSVAYLYELNSEELQDLAGVFKKLLGKFDGLWDRPFPYLMLLYQAPTDGLEHPDVHLYFQFTPPYRTKDRLKYLAGTELGAGIFVNDSFPEEKAQELAQARSIYE